MNVLTNAATIIVAATGQSYHTLNTWGLALKNNDCIGDPVLESYILDIPGSPYVFDMSEAIAGRPIFKSRSITLQLGGIRKRTDWDHVISDIRNKIDGRICHLIFDNDIGHYWKGRVSVSDFDRVRRLGSFTISMQQADPYKYNVLSSTDEWEWDPFDFESGVIEEVRNYSVSGSLDVNIPAGTMSVVPVFEVSASSNLVLQTGGKAYPLQNGRNRFPPVLVCGETDTLLHFTGTGNVLIEYRGGSL